MARGLTFQIVRALRSIHRQGESRHAAKADGTAAALVFSSSSLRTHIQRAVTSFRALPPGERPRELRDWRADHTRRMVAVWRRQGIAGVTVKNRLSSLRKLAGAVNALGWNPASPADLVPDALYADLRPSPPRGGYGEEDAARIIALLAAHPRGGTEARRFAALIWRSGLRRAEVAGLRERDLDRVAGTVWVSRANAKGGRARRVDLADDPAGRALLLAAIDAIPPGRNWLWTDGDRLAREVEEAIRAICAAEGIAPKGQHGLRATFAEDSLRRRIDGGAAEDMARDALALLLGHNRRSVTYRYVPRLTPCPPRRRRVAALSETGD